MYSTFKLAAKYIHYRVAASNGKGHGVHAPFVFEFITKVLNDNGTYYCYTPIEKLRILLKKNSTLLELEDFGAGSRIHATYKRKVSEIAASSLKPSKYAQLLFRMVNFYQPKNILELGTSLGVTTAYLACANPAIPVTTLEGAKAVAEIAQTNLERFGLKNIRIVQGNFDITLKQLLQSNKSTIDFAFIDGNHREEPTINYFHELLPYINEYSILIFDDVHWSREMEKAWEYIKTHEAVTLTIDLFFLGIVFFRKEQLVKQHFYIKF